MFNKLSYFVIAAALFSLTVAAQSPKELSRWRAQAENVDIIRDDFGIPHVYGKTDAFADGFNYYLHTHPEIQPKLLTHFEHWMPIYSSEGSIGGDTEHRWKVDVSIQYGVEGCCLLQRRCAEKGRGAISAR